MIPPLTIEISIAVLFGFNFFVVGFLVLIVKRINRFRLEEDRSNLQEKEDIQARISDSAAEMMDLMEPLVKESRKTAISFDRQIKEKKRLIKELNEALDSRIISINLLLSRADAQQKKLEETQSRNFQRPILPDNFKPEISQQVVDDQQSKILALYYQNADINAIAQQLSIPKGEVQLVIDLKEKFVAMEKNGE